MSAAAAQRSHYRGFELITGQGAGVTLRFNTAATWIAVEAHHTRFGFSDDVPHAIWQVDAPGVSRAVSVPVDHGAFIVERPDGTFEVRGGPASSIYFELGEARDGRLVRLWLPHTAGVRLTEVRSDAPLKAATASDGPAWVHYGSSISHCPDLRYPREIWPTRVGAELGLDVTNLGFAGNALLDRTAAAVICDLPASAISLEVGINIVNWDAFVERTYAPALHDFLDHIRSRHRITPMALITPIWCGIHEQDPGPTAVDAVTGRCVASSPRRTGAMTLQDIRRVAAEVVERRADPHLHLVDGRALLGAADEHLLFDGLHPDADGTALVATRFVAGARDATSALGRAFAAATPDASVLSEPAP